MDTTLTYSSLSKKALNSYKNYLQKQLINFNFQFKIVSLPNKSLKKTILKSPHVNKKAKENFILMKYKFFLRIKLDKILFNFFRSNVPKLLHIKWSFLFRGK